MRAVSFASKGKRQFLFLHICILTCLSYPDVSTVTSFVHVTNGVTKKSTRPKSTLMSVDGNNDGLSADPPIVYTIAGSDSGGGAGIQADLHAIHAFGCHGCSVITCLTAQNSVGVTMVHTPPIAFLNEQLKAVLEDLPPLAIKIGMIGTPEIAKAVGEFLRAIRNDDSNRGKVWVILDPVMISTSGHRLISDDTQQILINDVFPYVDLLTPNKHETETLLGGRLLQSENDVEEAAKDILKMGVSAVLIKGGHLMDIKNHDDNESRKQQQLAKDYFLSSAEYYGGEDFEARICDSPAGCWLQASWYENENTHGTGCTLSSSIASALALGEQARRRNGIGAYTSMDLVSACCLAKAYVTAGIESGVKLGKGPGPVRQTTFPDNDKHYPWVVSNPSRASHKLKFPRMNPATKIQSVDESNIAILGGILPIVDSIEWVERLCKTNKITDIQLRIKNMPTISEVAQLVQTAQNICQKSNVKLWINDYWEIAISCGCFGVHLGQEDLFKCAENGGLEKLHAAGLALGISTHSFAELSVALGIHPSYISLGPIFPTGSKKVNFDPQGLEAVRLWRTFIPPDIPLCAIGGIGDSETATLVREAGADCVAVIGAITQKPNTQEAVDVLSEAMLARR